MKTLEVSAKTVNEAVEQGLVELGLTYDQVRVDVLEEGNKGLFGLIGVKQAKVLLTIYEDEKELIASIFDPKEAPLAKPTAPVAKPAVPVAKPLAPVMKPLAPVAKPAGPRTNIPSRPIPQARPILHKHENFKENNAPLFPGEADKSLGFLTDVIRLIGVEVSIETKEREGTLCYDIQGDEKGILIGHRGETLDSLQYLTSLIQNKGSDDYRRVQIDSQNYRKRREDTLIRLANRLADKSYRSHQRVALEPMNPYERRILHAALQNNPNVTTHSEGDEPNRRVVIMPAK